MKPLLRCLWAEAVKLRRTAIPSLCVVGPILPVFFAALFAVDLQPAKETSWNWLTGAALATWGAVLLPSLMGVLCTLAAATEHRSRGLSLLFTRPISREILFASKQLLMQLLLGATWSLLGICLVSGGLLLRILEPGLGFENPLPGAFIARAMIAGWLASAFALSIQQWVALLRPGFLLPVGIAFLAIVSLPGLQFVAPELVPFHPWSYVSSAFEQAFEGQISWSSPLRGAVGALLFTALAAVGFARREAL